ncbi:MAG: hypothetical protein FJ062_02560 [Cyanobacteria bacterium M_DeepCast_100m_m1_067]|nr:hypothetical protein [Cyanobacteria bacterium M_DeepCast_100m_m1_067]
MSAVNARAFPPRSEAELRLKQERGQLQVRAAAAFRSLVQQAGLAEAYAATDVVVAADAGFTDQASLLLSLGPTDPPIRLRAGQLAGVQGLAGCGSGELVLPIGGGLGDAPGGAELLAALLQGRALPFDARGEATALHPRRELHTELGLEQIGTGRLLLHRAISENGVVALSQAEGPCPSPYGTLLGPAANALYSCSGAGSIGLSMPGLSLLGPGSPVLVGGALGWVVGAGSGHQPGCRRQASGHARTPGAAAAVSVDLHDLRPEWVRPCFFEGHGSALLVAIAAPVPLINADVARQAAAGPEALEAPVLDLSVPRRVKPSLGAVTYAELLSGTITVRGRSVGCAPSHSPRLAAAAAEALAEALLSGAFPLRLPLVPLSPRPSLLPIEA